MFCPEGYLLIEDVVMKCYLAADIVWPPSTKAVAGKTIEIDGVEIAGIDWANDWVLQGEMLFSHLFINFLEHKNHALRICSPQGSVLKIGFGIFDRKSDLEFIEKADLNYWHRYFGDTTSDNYYCYLDRRNWIVDVEKLAAISDGTVTIDNPNVSGKSTSKTLQPFSGWALCITEDALDITPEKILEICSVPGGWEYQYPKNKNVTGRPNFGPDVLAAYSRKFPGGRTPFTWKEICQQISGELGRSLHPDTVRNHILTSEKEAKSPRKTLGKT